MAGLSALGGLEKLIFDVEDNIYVVTKCTIIFDVIKDVILLFSQSTWLKTYVGAKDRYI